MGKKVMTGIAIGLVALVAGSLSIGQMQGRGGPGAGGQRPGGRFDPARMRQMMAERMKEQLGVDDQTWKVMEPRITKVMELNRQVSGGGRRGMFFGGFRGRRGTQGDQGNQADRGPGRRGGAQDRPERELTAVDKAEEQLQTTLEDQSASAETIKNQLKALRNARESAKQQLAKAQEDLRKILNMRQEARLVLMGMLD
jgi:hypothetical protein